MKENKRNVYQEHGYSNRKEYLKSLSEEYGVYIGAVYALADLLGAEEDFDGLISELEDYSEYIGDDDYDNDDFEEEGDDE